LFSLTSLRLCLALYLYLNFVPQKVFSCLAHSSHFAHLEVRLFSIFCAAKFFGLCGWNGIRLSLTSSSLLFSSQNGNCQRHLIHPDQVMPQGKSASSGINNYPTTTTTTFVSFLFDIDAYPCTSCSCPGRNPLAFYKLHKVLINCCSLLIAR